MSKRSSNFLAAQKLVRSQKAHERLVDFYAGTDHRSMQYHKDVLDLQAYHQRVLSQKERRAIYSRFFKK